MQINITKLSWKLLFRYCLVSVVIIVLGVLFCILVALLCAYFIYRVFFAHVPHWQQDDFYIESIPGLRYGPPDKDGEDTLIHFSISPDRYLGWTKVMEEATRGTVCRNKTLSRILPNVTAYLKPSNNSVECDFEKPPKPGKVCIQDISKWFPCVKENYFGYHKATPCVFLRFNKIANWTPQFYSNVTELPPDMPETLKLVISRQYKIYRSLMKTIWVSCSGETPMDVEHIGPVHYIPWQGFPGYFFPYNNTPNYLSPMVAVSFERPMVGVAISVECRLWAPNIEYDQEKGVGFVKFQLMID
ncbi:hypothetical protein ANN_05323 [Periplaneta americana]|uniref:Sodium/potassium-transporting ATPase subunit beta-2 n=1 Tax=Periplaneta americana TaxID=6978 RepID=A0ABQ8TBP8_PERAM|nr:hypothetical protein ANN_05323 [Periplaneta americana]